MFPIITPNCSNPNGIIVVSKLYIIAHGLDVKLVIRKLKHGVSFGVNMLMISETEKKSHILFNT